MRSKSQSLHRPSRPLKVRAKSRTERPLILASTSSSRILWLKRLGYHFDAVPSGVDEETEEANWLAQLRARQDRRGVCRHLARRKAVAVYESLQSARDVVVLGFDQGFFLRDRRGGWRQFHKPMSAASARRVLKLCSGQPACLVTAGSVVSCSPAGRLRSVAFSVTTHLRFRMLSAREIADYVRLDQPVGCAGALRFESRGLSLLEQIGRGDPATLEGLPALELRRALHSWTE